MFYLFEIHSAKDINKETYYLHLASKQGNADAQFVLGTIYFKGENIRREMKQAIFYYKEASSFYQSQAKNNLYCDNAVIYKNELDNEKILGYAIELLKEAVRLNDAVSMYNLSHLYFFENIIDKESKSIIEMLINLSEQIPSSIELLSIIMSKKHQSIAIETIEGEIKAQTTNISENKIHQISIGCLQIY